MKKALQISMALLVTSMVAYGAPVQPGDALASVRDKLPAGWSGEMSLRHTFSHDSKAALYVFGHGNDGFVVVAADDAVPDMLIGINEHGDFNLANLPEPLLALLEANAECVIRQSQSAPAAGPRKETAANGQQRTTISPLVDAHWGQGEPFNNKCPQVKDASGNTVRALTGCVATAMAQLMYAHKWPATGSGSNSYSGSSNGSSYSVSANFANTSYQWKDMFSTAGTTTSSTQKDNVATLVYHCGVAVNMQYGATASGATDIAIPTALTTYFKYDKAIHYYAPAWFDNETLRTVVYSQIASGRPVYFIGENYAARHSFLIDGYASSYEKFHFNFGYEGSYGEGYYQLPEAGGYGSNQVMYTDIKRESGGSVQPCIALDANISASASGKSVTFSGAYTSYAISSVGYNYGIYVNGTVYNQSSSTLGYKASGSLSTTVNLSGLAAGTYKAYPVFKATNASSWTPFYCNARNGNTNSVTLTVTSSGITVSSASATMPAVTIVNGPEEGTNPEPTTGTNLSVSLAGVSFSDSQRSYYYPGAGFTCNWNLTTDGAYNSTMYARIHDDYGTTLCSGTKRTVNITGAGTSSQSWSMTVPSSAATGRYNLALIKVDENGGETVVGSNIIWVSQKQDVVVEQTVNSYVELANVEYEDPYYPGQVGNKITATWRVYCDAPMTRTYSAKLVRTNNYTIAYATPGSQTVNVTNAEGGVVELTFTATIERHSAGASDTQEKLVLVYTDSNNLDHIEAPLTFDIFNPITVSSLNSYQLYAKLKSIKLVEDNTTQGASDDEWDEVSTASDDDSAITTLVGGNTYEFTWETARSSTTAATLNIAQNIGLPSSIDDYNMGSSLTSSEATSIEFNGPSDTHTVTYTMTIPYTLATDNYYLSLQGGSANRVSTPLTNMSIVNPMPTEVKNLERDCIDFEPIYYNLQGIRVEKPAKGIYIQVKGSKRTKVIF